MNAPDSGIHFRKEAIKMYSRKIKASFLFFCLLLALGGCVSQPTEALDGQKWQDDWQMVGTGLGIDAPETLTPADNKEALAADGLYYATWVAGDSVPYENSEGETVDLYDAQLYLLVSETTDETSAEKSCQTWLADAKERYEVKKTDTVTVNGQSYTLITYGCIGEDTPYDRGVSAFGVCGSTAVCAELTCTLDYGEDLTKLLKEFLNGCHYSAG